LLALRQQAGLDSGLEPSRSDAESQATRVQLAQINEALALAQDALAAWVGVAPAQLALHPVDLAQLPAMVLPTAVGANLLGRRPDIAAARQRVQAAQDNLQAARAAFYPDVNLMAFAGLSSIGLDTLLDAGSRQWGAGAALSLPLFDGNALRAQAQARSAGVDLAIHTYNASLLTALREALDALARVQGAQQAWQAQQLVLQASQRTLTLHQRQQQAGLAPRTGVLAAQATVAAQQAQSLALRSRLLQSQAALALALGGGWQATPNMQLY
jgi:outer membrane protein TolC